MFFTCQAVFCQAFRVLKISKIKFAVLSRCCDRNPINLVKRSRVVRQTGCGFFDLLRLN
jgi:hypothetical protein